jgi:predicted nicotinamide N-methyase
MSDPVATTLVPVPAVPELRLHQAAEATGLWDRTGGGYRSDQPPPFWAFAWPGGQALARYVLDNPDTVAGRRVLDLASGSGVVAIAAATAGAAHVLAADIDPAAVAAITRNARANGVSVAVTSDDVLGADARGATVVLAGDAFYSRTMADRVLGFLRRARNGGARVLVGDPDRDFLPRRLFTALTSYDVPVRPALEDTGVKRTTIWELG